MTEKKPYYDRTACNITSTEKSVRIMVINEWYHDIDKWKADIREHENHMVESGTPEVHHLVIERKKIEIQIAEDVIKYLLNNHFTKDDVLKQIFKDRLYYGHQMSMNPSAVFVRRCGHALVMLDKLKTVVQGIPE